MTAPICHGTAGGCIASDWTHLGHHTDDCPVQLALLTPPTKRTMGQCSEECREWRRTMGFAVDKGHLAACPALYLLQRQPGDEKDALTRLTAFLRQLVDDGTMEGIALHGALDLISEAREEHKAADAQRSKEWQQERTGRNALGERVLDLEKQRDMFRIELARAKALVTTLTGQQSEVRQRAQRDLATELTLLNPDERWTRCATLAGPVEPE